MHRLRHLVSGNGIGAHKSIKLIGGKPLRLQDGSEIGEYEKYNFDSIHGCVLGLLKKPGHHVINEPDAGVDAMNITEECFNHNARISTIIHIGSAIVDEDTLSDALDRFIEDDLWDLSYELFPVKNPFAATDDVDGMEVPYKVEAAEWLIHNRLFGFLVQVDTPVINPETVRLNDEGDLSGYSYTWGYYRHRWFYADTFEEAATAGIEWAKGRADAAVEKARELAKEGS